MIFCIPMLPSRLHTSFTFSNLIIFYVYDRCALQRLIDKQSGLLRQWVRGSAQRQNKFLLLIRNNNWSNYKDSWYVAYHYFLFLSYQLNSDPTNGILIFLFIADYHRSYGLLHLLVLLFIISAVGLLGKGLKSHENMYISPLGTRIAFIGES